MENCNCCGTKLTVKAKNTPAVAADGYTPVIGIYNCQSCGAFLGTCYKGEFYTIVKNRWYTGPERPENQVYFDIDTLGSDGIKRHHGWMDATTRELTQTG